MDGKANKEGGPSSAMSLRRPQFAPGQDALLDGAPPSDSLAQAFSTNPAAIRARKAREGRARHRPPVKGPQAPAITGRARVVATTNAASPGVAALHNGRTGVVTKRAAGWIEVQLDATRDKPSETIRAASATSSRSTRPGEPSRRPRARPRRSSASRRRRGPRARREAGMRGEVEEEEEEAPRVVRARGRPRRRTAGRR